MTIGVLAFQGDFAEHILILHRLRVPSVEVRTLDDLSKVNALIIPGGESTVIAKFLQESGVGKEIIRRVRQGAPLPVAPQSLGEGLGRGLFVFGTCAGAIVLARKVKGKEKIRTLGLIDITVERNAYGTQIESFETILNIKNIKEPLLVSFIRAPKIVRIGKGVEVLAEDHGLPVLVRQGNVIAATFHPEVRGETALHRYIVSQIS